MIRFLFIFVLLLCSHASQSQSNFYSVDSIRQIRIYFEQANWDYILDSFYVKGEKERLLGSVIIDGIEYRDVGIRYKGFSSVSIDRTKNPFNIKLDYTIDGQNHEGFDKIKLSNVIQDPSFVREVLAYEIARKYMPASEANFANVYVNDTLLGLYTNVEAVNKDFVSKHYSSRDNTFFKCNPEHIDLNGENSNLSTSPGNDTSDYYPYYDLESDYGWQDLYHFIDTLNNYPNEIPPLLNVDQTLWMHAFNYATINFDSYIGYAQNYYLYADNLGRFNPVVWDLNMSFGSFRFTDASENYRGFTVEDAPLMDPWAHLLSVSVYARPLMRNLFINPMYRKMFLAHLRTILDENIASGEYYSRATQFQTLIDEHVKVDSNKFYTYDQFHENLDSTVSDLIEYPGIKDLMEKRLAYLNSYPAFREGPEISEVSYSPSDVKMGEDVLILASVADAKSVTLAYRFGRNDKFVKVQMNDDGVGIDSVDDDGVYTAKVYNLGSVLQYYVYAQNDSVGKFSPERAAYEFYEIDFKLNSGDLVINEVMARNSSFRADQDGVYSDWIELYNTSSSPISTQGMYLTDDRNKPLQWSMPDRTIQANDYLIVWANGSVENGLNANFKLSSNGENVQLSYADGTVIDDMSFGEQKPNISFARFPNGTGNFEFLYPTFGSNNDSSRIYTEFDVNDFICYPNPASDEFHVRVDSDTSSIFQLIDMKGQYLIEDTLSPDNVVTTFSSSGLTNGIYLIRIVNRGFAATKRLIII
jgi:hypothetical protein